MACSENNDMASVKLVDGLIILGDDPKMLGVVEDIIIYKNFAVKKFDTSLFRGTLAFNGKRTLFIPLSISQDPEVVVLITPSNKTVWTDDDIIKSSFAEAVDYAINNMNPITLTSTITPGDYKASNPCHALHVVSSGTYCSTCSHGRLKIHHTEVPEFASLFLDRMKHNMHTRKRQRLMDDEAFSAQSDLETAIQERMKNDGYDYKCYFAIYGFGQSSPFDAYIRKITEKGFQPQHAMEVILHVARDYAMPNNCLLWSLDDICQQENVLIRGEKKIFNNLMTFGHGNVTFDRTKDPLYAAIHDSGIHYATLKFYTDSFKRIHRNCPDDIVRWKNPLVEAALTYVRDLLCNPYVQDTDQNCFDERRHELKEVRQPKDVMAHIAAVEAEFERIKAAKRNVARFEAIIGIPSRDLLGLNPQEIWEKFSQFFKFILGQFKVEKNWIRMFDYDDFLTQIDNTIMTAVKTLKPIIQNVIRRRSEGAVLMSIPDAVTLQLANVCEQIISFCIYGRVNFYANEAKLKNKKSKRKPKGRNQASSTAEEIEKKPRKYHVNELAKELKLKNATYRELPEDGNPFKGLKGCGKTLVVRNRKLVWKGALYLNVETWTNLSDETEGGAERLRQILCNIHAIVTRDDIENANEYFPEICEFFWNAVNTYAGRTLEPGGEEGIDIDSDYVRNYLNQQDRATFEFDASEVFIDRFLKHSEDFDQHGIAHFMRDLMSILDGNDAKKLLRNQLVKYFEGKLYRSSNLVLMYPIRVNRRLFVILPYLGTEEDNYEQSSDLSVNRGREKQKKIRSIYSHPIRIYCKMSAATWSVSINNYLRQLKLRDCSLMQV